MNTRWVSSSPRLAEGLLLGQPIGVATEVALQTRQCLAICKKIASDVVAGAQPAPLTVRAPAGVIDIHRILGQAPVLQLAMRPGKRV